MKTSLLAVLFVLAIFCHIGPKTVCSRKIVKSLPGFDGPLPFDLETGYVEVDEEQGVNLFYYFIKSEKIPAEDPLMYFIAGGPGCSALNTLAYEIGPLRFDSESYDGGSTPKLIYWQDSWTRIGSIIFVDWPAGTGYSYARGDMKNTWSDSKASELHQVFIRKWLSEHPEFVSNPFYVGGASYGGKIVPIVAQKIIDGNEAGAVPFVNVKGYVAGNPVTTEDRYDEDTKVDFARGMGLISQELYEDTKKNCGENFASASNSECKKCLDSVKENFAGLLRVFILEPDCGLDSPKPWEFFQNERFLIDLNTNPAHYLQMKMKRCREYVYVLLNVWSNNVAVQEALGVSKEWSGNWIRCNRTVTNMHSVDIPSPVPYYYNITSRGIRGLVYSGDHDLSVNFVGTQAWIRSLNFSITSEWRSWRVDGQVAGYTRSYAPQLTFATVKGAGHLAPVYKPKECKVMFERWISGENL